MSNMFNKKMVRLRSRHRLAKASILSDLKQYQYVKESHNELQYTDSCIAEKVMLRFIKSDDAPALPVHDSFIMHHAFGEELGELEEAMRRAFYEHFKKDINVKSEIGVMLPSSFDGKDSDELTIEQIVHGPPEYSQWEARNS